MYPQEAPRQGTLSGGTGRIVLKKNCNFETALADLEGVERIWIIFVFDRVKGWKPKVRPPLGGLSRRIGVFATRSPHRPNPIGITSARLLSVQGLELEVSEIDLLDNTPVLDIKPYIPMADAFPDARTGWREEVDLPDMQLLPDSAADEEIRFILQNGGPDLANVCHVQLLTREYDPRRMRLSGPDENGRQIFAFRTWRVVFEKDPESKQIRVLEVFSGYDAEELAPGAEDPYKDKELHRMFRAVFPAAGKIFVGKSV